MVAMDLINLDTWNSYGRAFEEAGEAVLAGEIVIYPTDTIYKIGAKATDKDAVSKLRRVMEKDSPLPILVSDLNMMRKYCRTDAVPFVLLQQLFPGPVTGIFPKIYDFPEGITEDENVRIRIPAHNFIVSLVRKFDFPVTSARANLTVGRPPKTVEEIPTELKKIAKVVVDGGRCRYGVDSTVIDFTTKPAEIVREGAASKSIADIIKNCPE